MPTVVVRTAASTRRVATPPHPKMQFILETGQTLTVPYAPVSVSHDGIAGSHSQTPRYGREPLLSRTGQPLHSIGFSLVIAYPDPQTSVEPILASLRAVARSKARVRTVLGPSEQGWFRVTNFTFESMMRQTGTNAITRAVASMTLTRASDAQLRVSPLTGGAKTPPKPTTAAGRGGGGAATATRRHTVRSGDTLFKIAQTHLGDGNKWKSIADANKVTDPRKLRIGQVLVIP